MKWLILVLLAALLLRVGWVLAVPTLPGFGVHDTSVYDSVARNLAAGDGFQFEVLNADGSSTSGRSLLKPPGYQAFLAGSYFLFGSHTETARFANAVVSALTVLPAYWAARRFLDGRASLCAAGLVAINPSMIVWTSSLYPEALFLPVFTSAIAAVLWTRVESRINLRMAFLAAALLAASVLIREVAVALIPVGALWFGWRRPWPEGLRRATLLLAGLPVLVILSWTVRNAIVVDAPVYTTSTGIIFRIGHAPYSTGTYVRPADLWEAAGEPTAIETELSAHREGFKQGIEYALNHPQREVELAIRKLGFLWRPSLDAVQDAELSGRTDLGWARLPARAAVISFHVSLLTLVLVWLYVSRRNTEALIVPLGLIAIWTLGHVALFALPRYHVPLLPLLSVTAAGAIAYLLDLLYARGGIRLGRDEVQQAAET